MLKKLFKQYVNKETISYLIFGVLTTAVDFIIFQLILLTGLHYLIAQGVAWAGAVAFAFVTNKLFVFGSKDTSLPVVMRELITFVGGRVISGVISTLMLAGLVELLFLPELPAKLLTQVFVVIANYVISKLFIFRKH